MENELLSTDGDGASAPERGIRLHPTDMDDFTSRLVDSRRMDTSSPRSQQPWRAARRGELERVRQGIYRPPLPSIDTLDPDARHTELRRRYLDRIEAVVLTRRGDVVLSHESAAALLGLPQLGPWPREVHLLEPLGSSRRSKNGGLIHRTAIAEEDIIRHGDFLITAPLRTALDLARTRSFVRAVTVLDFAIRAGLPREALLERLDASGLNGTARARAAIEFANPLAASPGESVSRVLLRVLGCPTPVLQRRHPTPAALALAYFETDLEWPDLKKIAEFDGAGKYLKPEYLKGRTPGEAVVEEKLREDALRREGNDVSRWGWYELQRPWLVRSALLAIGMPMRRSTGPLARLW